MSDKTFSFIENFLTLILKERDSLLREQEAWTAVLQIYRSDRRSAVPPLPTRPIRHGRDAEPNPEVRRALFERSEFARRWIRRASKGIPRTTPRANGFGYFCRNKSGSAAGTKPDNYHSIKNMRNNECVGKDLLRGRNLLG
jgi:hypothetical protein